MRDTSNLKPGDVVHVKGEMRTTPRAGARRMSPLTFGFMDLLELACVGTFVGCLLLLAVGFGGA
jgi:hypothetical protein